MLERFRRLRGTPKAFWVQAIAFALSAGLFAMLGHWLPTPWAWVFFQAGFSVLLCRWFASDPWWVWIHLGFFPVAFLTSQFRVAPGWYLALFVLLALVYGSHFRSQVPLFLSNTTTADTLLGLIPADKPLRFLDFGSGLGGVVLHVARHRPHSHCEGVEGAFLPAMAARLLALGQGNADLRWGDFWKTDLSGFDVVYAFLSPVPMPALWEKACREMRPGSLLISNSFTIPGVKPVRVVRVDDRRSTQLWLYRIP